MITTHTLLPKEAYQIIQEANKIKDRQQKIDEEIKVINEVADIYTFLLNSAEEKTLFNNYFFYPTKISDEATKQLSTEGISSTITNGKTILSWKSSITIHQVLSLE